MNNIGKSKLETEFVKLKKAFKKLKSLEGDEYYKNFDLLKAQFNEFLHAFGAGQIAMFTQLKRQSFIDLCCMVSTIRPCEPWQFLVKISACEDFKK